MNEERASDTSKTAETDPFEDLFGRPRRVGTAGTEVGSGPGPSAPAAGGARPPEREARRLVRIGEAGGDQAHSEFQQRFGPTAPQLGFTQVPNVLLDELIRRAQLKPGAALVLIRLLRHWHTRDRWPFPGQESLAEQTGQSVRSVQRCVAELREKRLISTKARHRKGSNDRTSDEYDLRPLIVMLHAIAEDLEGRQVYWNDELVEVPGSAS